MSIQKDIPQLRRVSGNEAKIFGTLGKINSCVSSASTFDEAIRGEMRMIVDSGIADHVIVWRVDENSGKCYPYYWIFPADLTMRSRRLGDGIVGRVCKNRETKSVIDFRADGTEEEKKTLEGAEVCSLVCVPFDIGGSVGCMEFLKSGESEPFSQDEAEMCRIVAMISEMYIKELAPMPDTADRGEIIISARGIEKSFLSGGNISRVLKGVNLDISDGELLCLLGESGCGKSTFLNILGGLLDADGGNLSFMGKDILKMNEDDLTEYRRRYIGFVFQSYNLMPNLTAKQNLDLIGELAGDAMDSREVLELVGMSDKGRNYPSQLSGGEQQRISIARALIKKPKIILADEPTAALDYRKSIEILDVFEKIKKAGTTILMVTHNEEITRMADRIVRFRDGKTHEMIINHRPAGAGELIW